MSPPPSTLEEVARLLPYGREFVFVDRVVAIEPLESIVTATDYHPSRWPLPAHFLNGPKVVPGAILSEQACQSAALLWRLSSQRPSGPLVLGRIEAVFRRPVSAGRCVQMAVTVELSLPTKVAFTAIARCGDVDVAKINAVASQASTDFGS